MSELAADFDVFAIASAATVAGGRARWPTIDWLEWDFERRDPSLLPADLARTTVVCSGVIEQLADPSLLLERLARLADESAVVVLSTQARASGDLGPPEDLEHVREWTLGELERLLECRGVGVEFAGLTLTGDGLGRRTSVFVLRPGGQSLRVPAGFSVLAFVTTFNEADIVRDAVEHLAGEGVSVYIIDNWSNDGTWEIVRDLIGRGAVAGAERFPADGPSDSFALRPLLRRVEELSTTLHADWYVHADADERRESPWPGVCLREGLWRVDEAGFNAVDHTVVSFPPVDDGYRPGDDVAAYFRHFEFGRNPGHFAQVKAWRRADGPVELAVSGGHSASFPGRRIFPFNFLSKHYPFRSQAHAERKVFQERRGRFSPVERAEGWHVQYDEFEPGQGFLRDPEELELFEPERFARDYLVERLSRVGIPRPASGAMRV